MPFLSLAPFTQSAALPFKRPFLCFTSYEAYRLMRVFLLSATTENVYRSLSPMG